MSKLDQVIGELKLHLGEDAEEKMLREKFNEFGSAFAKMYRELRKTEKGSFNAEWSLDTKFVEIEDVKLELQLNRETNTIEVSKKDGSGSTELDEIILQNGELYCVRKSVEFTEDVFSDYVREVFAEIIG